MLRSDSQLVYMFIKETGVGKTCLCNRFIYDNFNAIEPTTIGAAFQTKEVFWNGKLYKLLIWDTAGQERFRNIAPLYYRGAKVVIIVYDVTDMKSAQQVQFWLREIRKHAPLETLVFVAGNKCDRTEARQVDKAVVDGYLIYTEGAHFETSAKTGENVEHLFNAIIEKIDGKMFQETPNAIQLHKSPSPVPEKKNCC